MNRNRETAVVIAWAVAVVASAASAVGLLALRIERTDSWQWSFLLINLALSWIPLAFAALVYLPARLGAPRWALIPSSAAWLAFIPNAPYMWTDLVHLAGHPRPLFVTDLLLISSFAAAGLLAGYASLYLVHAAIERSFGSLAGWLVITCVLPLVSLGVYIGRVLRWNSWDSLARLDDFLRLAKMRVSDPFGNPMLLAACVLMTVCLAVGYGIVFALTRLALISRRGFPLIQP